MPFLLSILFISLVPVIILLWLLRNMQQSDKKWRQIIRDKQNNINFWKKTGI